MGIRSVSKSWRLSRTSSERFRFLYVRLFIVSKVKLMLNSTCLQGMVGLGHITLLIRRPGLLLFVTHRFYPLLIPRYSKYGRRRKKLYMHSDIAYHTYCLSSGNQEIINVLVAGTKNSSDSRLTFLMNFDHSLNMRFHIGDPYWYWENPNPLVKSSNVFHNFCSRTRRKFKYNNCRTSYCAVVATVQKVHDVAKCHTQIAHYIGPEICGESLSFLVVMSNFFSLPPWMEPSPILGMSTSVYDTKIMV